jgi:hypothetical protein
MNMTCTRSIGAWIAGATTLSIAGGAFAAADASSDMAKQIAELKAANDALAAKVTKLEQGANGEQWLTEQRADEIRSIVSDVLADAGTRDSLQGSGATAGWNKDQGGFFLASPSGDFKLNIKGQIQFRWAFNHRDNQGITSPSPAFKEDVWGFENRRTKLAFTGFVVDPSWSYEVQLVMNRTPGSVSSGSQTFSSGNIVGSVENIWIQKDFGNGIMVRAGQFKTPFLREELVSSSAQLAVERSLVSDVFSTKFGQGIQAEFGGRAGEQWKALAFYGDGLRANATSVPTSVTSAAGGYAGGYTTPFSTNATNWAFAGRLEYLGAGNWKSMRDFNSYRGEEMGWMIGLGGMGQSLRPTTEGTQTASTTDSMWGVTADFTMNFGGASFFAYGVYRDVQLAGNVATRGGGTSDSMGQWGAVVQGGYFITNEVELYARYELGDTDTDKFRVADTGIDLQSNSIVTLGLNYFVGGNKDIKWTSDFGYAFTPIGDFNSSGADWLQDGSSTAGNGFTNDGQWVVRTQLQLLF